LLRETAYEIRAIEIHVDTFIIFDIIPPPQEKYLSIESAAFKIPHLLNAISCHTFKSTLHTAIQRSSEFVFILLFASMINIEMPRIMSSQDTKPNFQ